jgi:alkyl hydroperoxide reductase subunit AhpC
LICQSDWATKRLISRRKPPRDLSSSTIGRASRGRFFSHPKDFTPVCTTELGALAALKPEFDKRNTKVIGLSVDPLTSHEKWQGDIKDVTGQTVNFPMIADGDRKVSNLYGMIHPNAATR